MEGIWRTPDRVGIITGMLSDSFSVDADNVLESLGDKLLAAWASAVANATADLAEYRAALPSQAAAHGPRGMSNVIHDLLWQHLKAETDDMDEVTVFESGPLRELIVHDRFRIRVKRHHGTGAIASYPTDQALRFYGQHPPPGQFVLFDDLPEMTNLVFGYIWHPELGEMGAATVSYPTSRSDTLWIREIRPQAPSGVIVPSRPDAPAPTVRPMETNVDTRRHSKA